MIDNNVREPHSNEINNVAFEQIDDSDQPGHPLYEGHLESS